MKSKLTFHMNQHSLLTLLAYYTLSGTMLINMPLVSFYMFSGEISDQNSKTDHYLNRSHDTKKHTPKAWFVDHLGFAY